MRCLLFCDGMGSKICLLPFTLFIKEIINAVPATAAAAIIILLFIPFLFTEYNRCAKVKVGKIKFLMTFLKDRGSDAQHGALAIGA